MGIVSTILPQSNNMILLLLVVLVASVHADADADPQLLLAGSPLVYGAHHLLHTPVKSVEVKTTALTYTYAGYPYAGIYGNYGYPYVFRHGLPLTVAAPAEEEAPAVESARKKREAKPEADPNADPLYLTYGYHTPVTYTAPVVKPVEVKTPVVYNSLVHPYTYGYGYPHTYVLHYPYTYGYPHLVAPKPAEEPAVESERKRRDADADAALLYGGYHYPYAYSGYPYTYSGYHYPYYAYGK